MRTIGDAIMATFVEPVAGLRTAMHMSQRLDEFDRTSSSDLVLKMGLHRGHTIAVDSNGSVDYFGQTVNIAVRIQAMADAGEIRISEDVHSAPGAGDLLASLTVARMVPLMKGVAEEIPVYRVTIGWQRSGRRCSSSDREGR